MNGYNTDKMPTKIALIGHGTMGRAIEAAARQNEAYEIVLVVDSQNRATMTATQLQQADVVIEVSHPEAAFANVQWALAAGLPVVCGTTGWTDRLPAIEKRVRTEGGAFLYASNFSVGVNLLFAVNRYLATLMNDRPDYDVALHEVHHTRKKDAPSGTAITLAEGLLDLLDRKTDWSMDTLPQSDKLYVSASRLGDTPGTHEVTYRSDADQITLRHEAYNRTGFAQGALLAARWLAGRQGVYTMADVLDISRILTT